MTHVYKYSIKAVLAAFTLGIVSATSAQGSDLFDRYGLKLDIVPIEGLNGIEAIVVSDVLDGSEAAISGFEVGDAFYQIESRVADRRWSDGKVRTDAISVPELEAAIIDHIDLTGYLNVTTTSDVAAFTFGRADRRAKLPKLLDGVLFPITGVSEHLGMRTDDYFVVTEVSQISPASEAGLQTGDHVIGIEGVAFVPTNEATILARIMENVTQGYGTFVLRIRRNGNEMALDMPTRGVGEAF